MATTTLPVISMLWDYIKTIIIVLYEFIKQLIGHPAVLGIVLFLLIVGAIKRWFSK